MPSPAFTLRIFESEYKEIQTLVTKYENIETGGDLFGLWSRDSEPVVQLIIGPGERCRRTSVSFHQDTDYLQNVGTFLNTSFMLCHIGSWHSHHQLSLTHPSAGDHSTVRNNFPRGLERYIMIIANIVCPPRSEPNSVVIHPYMFTSEGHVCKPGTVEVIPNPSPFREDRRVLGAICQGEERNQVISNHRGIELPRRTSPPFNRTSCLRENKCPPVAPKHSEKFTAEEQNAVPKQDVVDQWYSSPEGQEKLKEIHRKILTLIQNERKNSHLKVDGDIKFTRSLNSLDLTLEFFHNDRKWTIEFRKSFDDVHARISYTALNSQISRSRCVPNPFKDIVELVQDLCGCTTCEVARNGKTVKKHANPELSECSDCYNHKKKQSFTLEENRLFTPVNPPKIGESDNDSIEHSLEELMLMSEVRDYERSSGAGENETSDIHFQIADEDRDTIAYNNQEVTDVSSDRGDKRFLSVEESETSDHFSESSTRALDTDMVDNNSQITERSQSPELKSCATIRKNSTAREKEIHQWYTSSQGREKLKKIHELVRSIFKPSNKVEFCRKADSHDLVLEFFHGDCKWTIEFPKLFDDEEAKILVVKHYSLNALVHCTVSSKNLIKIIQELCQCNDCRVENRRGEITDLVNKRSNENLERPAGMAADGKLQQVKSSPVTTGYESPSCESYQPLTSPTSLSPGKSKALRPCLTRKVSPYHRERKRTATADPVIAHRTNSETGLLRDRINSLLGQSGNGTVETKTNPAGQPVSLQFNHGHCDWIITLPNKSPQTKAKLYQREKGSRSFLDNVTPADVVETLRRFCECRKCVTWAIPKRKLGRNNAYVNVPLRKFSDQ